MRAKRPGAKRPRGWTGFGAKRPGTIFYIFFTETSACGCATRPQTGTIICFYHTVIEYLLWKKCVTTCPFSLNRCVLYDSFHFLFSFLFFWLDINVKCYLIYPRNICFISNAWQTQIGKGNNPNETCLAINKQDFLQKLFLSVIMT